LDILKKLKSEAQERQRRGGAAEKAAPKYEPAGKYFVSSNWKTLLAKRPKIAPKAAATTGPTPPDGGAATNVVALDCEMVGVGPSGGRNALARCSIVDSEGAVLMDRFVRPNEEVTDYRSHITGITAVTLRRPNVMTEEAAIRRAEELMRDKVVVGHSVSNDFQVLMLSHPHALVRDTALFHPLRPLGREMKTPSLQGLAAYWLHENIHGGAHDSVEDARVALRLYRLKSRLWEKQLRSVMKQHQMSGGAEVEESDDEGERVEPQQSRPAPVAKKKGKKEAAAARRAGAGEAAGEDAASSDAKQVYKNPGKKQRKKQRAAS